MSLQHPCLPSPARLWLVLDERHKIPVSKKKEQTVIMKCENKNVKIQKEPVIFIFSLVGSEPVQSGGPL